jgi:HEPN domain-containing protein
MNYPNLPIWYRSDWLILRRNSEEYLKMMYLAYNNGIHTQVLHNGHIAIELLLKAAISRQYGRHPHGHEIRLLTDQIIGGKTILSEVNSDFTRLGNFTKIYTAWKMQYRYEVKSVAPETSARYLNAFQEAYRWIKIKYCQ